MLDYIAARFHWHHLVVLGAIIGMLVFVLVAIIGGVCTCAAVSIKRRQKGTHTDCYYLLQHNNDEIFLTNRSFGDEYSRQ